MLSDVVGIVGRKKNRLLNAADKRYRRWRHIHARRLIHAAMLCGFLRNRRYRRGAVDGHPVQLAQQPRAAAAGLEGGSESFGVARP